MELEYDLAACLESNPQPGITAETIKRVVALSEGQNDDRDWLWILELNDGRFAWLRGGCDYTGWDCQSWADAKIFSTAIDAILGMAASDGDTLDLIKQWHSGKRAQTWREKNEDEARSVLVRMDIDEVRALFAKIGYRIVLQ